MRCLLVVCSLFLTALTAECCCDNPFPSTKPPEPTGVTIVLQSATSALLRWDALPCHSDWLIQIHEKYIYCGPFYCYPTQGEDVINLVPETIVWIDEESDLPWYPGVPRKIYQLCVANTHTGEHTCAPRWVGLQ